MKLEAPSADLFYNVIAENGKDEFDKLAKELATNLNAARKRWEDEQKAKAEKQRLINERKAKEDRAALAISSHLNDLFSDYWPMQQSSDYARALIEELKTTAQKMSEVQENAEKLAEKVPVVEKKETPSGNKTVRAGKIDPKDPDIENLYKLIADLFK